MEGGPCNLNIWKFVDLFLWKITNKTQLRDWKFEISKFRNLKFKKMKIENLNFWNFKIWNSEIWNSEILKFEILKFEILASFQHLRVLLRSTIWALEKLQDLEDLRIVVFQLRRSLVSQYKRSLVLHQKTYLI